MKPARHYFLVALLAVSCGEPTTRLKAKNEGPPNFQPIDVTALPKPSDPVLARGQEVYIQYCGRCHRIGKVGAPRIGDQAAWAIRQQKGLDTLIRNAVEGYESPNGNEMPARGGEETLTDADVESAVQFMLHLSQ